MDCIFCKIINKEYHSEPVYEDENYIVLNDLHPKARVHMLIIPKRHIETINHLDDADDVLIWWLFLIARDLAKKMNIGWYKLSFNVWKEWWQEIFHIHLHFLAN
ncbi:MAG: Histidine triad nucleotide-binding protein 2 [uncultured bacterium (gcode 4)]|uniref:Histidine triad nucleotide-binding protein 2 n=1 Tax=uncultured bacterium (gcode 4) TaxID=1234023 RepID=K2GW69_9BACT|nr:MAG: Histidine triad nucleotide-binding protein 2 [uncultured bacterium (gcode 4)]